MDKYVDGTDNKIEQWALDQDQRDLEEEEKFEAAKLQAKKDKEEAEKKEIIENLKKPVEEEEKKELVFTEEKKEEKVVTPIQVDPFSNTKQIVDDVRKEEQKALE